MDECAMVLGTAGKRTMEKRAWALMEPTGEGRFSPHGAFVGWSEKVRRFSQGGSGSCPHCDVAKKFERNLGPLQAWEMPEVFVTGMLHRELASMVMLPYGLLAVDERLKTLIERVEPGVHQFFPLRIEMPRGHTPPVSYHGLIILRWLDSFVPEKSSDFSKSTYPSGITRYRGGWTMQEVSRLAFSEDRIGGAHLWREERLSRPEIFISDHLASLIDEAGLMTFRLFPVRLV